MSNLHFTGSSATMTAAQYRDNIRQYIYLWQSCSLNIPGLHDLELGAVTFVDLWTTPHNLGPDGLIGTERCVLATGTSCCNPEAFELKGVPAEPGPELDAAIEFMDRVAEGTPEPKPYEEQFGWRKNLLAALRVRAEGKAYVATDPGGGDEGATIYASTVNVMGPLEGAVPDIEVYHPVPISEIPDDAKWVDGSGSTNAEGSSDDAPHSLYQGKGGFGKPASTAEIPDNASWFGRLGDN